jgi:raffinose/stachyose/melibiose transport system substrate-binding protein
MSTTSRRTMLASALLPLAGLARAQSPTVLSFWHNHPEWKDRVVAILRRFEAANPTIRLDHQEMPSAAYVPRMNTALAAGEAPDLMALRAGLDVVAAAKAGYIADLTGRLDISSLTASAQSASMVGGRLYGVPVLGAYTVALYYNRDILAKHGIAPPVTWEELIAACTALQAKRVVPLICPAQDVSIPGFTYMLIASSLLGPEGFVALCKGRRKLTDPDLLPAATFFRDLYRFYQPGAIGTAYTEGKALFALGRGAMMVAGSADYAGFTTTNAKVNFGVVPFPAPPNGWPATVTGMQGIFCINARTQHMDQALIFLRWMLRKEAAQMVIDTITLSTSREVQPSENRVMKEMVAAAAGHDLRVWFELPETAKVFSTTGMKAQSLFLGELSVEKFSAALHDVIDPAAAW